MDWARVAKSKAALSGMTMDEYLTKLLIVALRKDGKKMKGAM